MKFVAYCRISSEQKQKDNYSLEAQMQAVHRYLGGLSHQWELIGSFNEMETGSYSSEKRPQLAKAIALAKVQNARIICSRLDRLSRNHSFFVQLQESGADIIFLDALGADKFTLGILSLVSCKERDNLIARTKAGLQIARERLKAQGRRLGNPRPAESLKRATQANIDAKNSYSESIIVSIRELQSLGITSYNRLATSLTKRGERTRLGKPFTATGVRRILLASLNNALIWPNQLR